MINPNKERLKLMTTTRKKIVLAYSGGLDTSVAVPWLQENYNADVYHLHH